ncbi:hypothetical protein HY249_00900 [Candidatus Azambacteria bacterium]|nr:hypothetical protein [Candidatus Azambacteria bacterium]
MKMPSINIFWEYFRFQEFNKIIKEGELIIKSGRPVDIELLKVIGLAYDQDAINTKNKARKKSTKKAPKRFLEL